MRALVAESARPRPWHEACSQAWHHPLVEVPMLAVTLFLTSFSTFATLILGWLLGAMLVASLFLFRRHQIRVHDEHM